MVVAMNNGVKNGGPKDHELGYEGNLEDLIKTPHDRLNDPMYATLRILRAVCANLSIYKGVEVSTGELEKLLEEARSKGTDKVTIKFDPLLSEYLGKSMLIELKNSTLNAIDFIKNDSAIDRLSAGKKKEIADAEYRLKEEANILPDSATLSKFIEGFSLESEVWHDALLPVCDKYQKKDELTELYTWSAFSELAGELALNLLYRGENSSFVMIDLDGFKQYNSYAGHDQANMVVKQTAQILSENLSGGVPTRIHGDEFGVVMFGTASKGTAGAIENLLREYQSKIVPYTNEALFKSGVNYKAGFENSCKKQLSLSAGISSVTLPADNAGEESVFMFQRILSYLDKSNPANKKICSALTEWCETKGPPYLINDIIDKLEPDKDGRAKIKKMLASRTIELLKKEANYALLKAKNNKPSVEIYSPKIPIAEYEQK
jgi:diguanylate cyclase (GGDEF)-like protein